MKTDFRFAAMTAKGIDERVPADPESADLVSNFTRDFRTNAWDSRIGWERYMSSRADFVPWATAKRIDSMFIWSRNNGAQEWMLTEENGNLTFLRHMQASLHTLDSGRAVPVPTTPCTQYVPMGRWLIILNGVDRPMKWLGWPIDINSSPSANPGNLLYSLGWDGAPSIPEPWDVKESPKVSLEGGRTCSLPNTYQGGSGDDNDWTVNKTFVGTSTDSVWPAYFYKVTYVNNSGSESPVSGSSRMLSWQNQATSGAFKHATYAVIVDIPRGPEGTIARRIYRTKNQGSGEKTLLAADVSSGDGLFYFVGQVDNNIEPMFIDTVSDSELGMGAPTVASSIKFPAPKARFGAVFKSCLFLDGGAEETARLYWSDPGSPDSFAALSYTDLSGSPGGAVTGLYAYYNMLLVFRERGIDVVTGDYANGFQIATLRQNISPRAPNTIATIPALGVIFLAEDGLYLLSGGVQGGAQIEVKRITDKIMGTMKRVNRDTLPRAVGAYSHKHREYHCYFAADGEDRPTVGVVLHTETLQWSIRNGFPVGAITVNRSGDFIFGHHTGADAGANFPAGLFAISGKRQNGYTYSDGEVVDVVGPTSVWRSPFHDFGRPEQKKFVKFVYLYVMTTGNNLISIEYMKDYELDGISSLGYKMQVPDRIEQVVYDTVQFGAGAWDRPRVTEVRYPIADGACSHFQFQVSTTNDFVLVGYAIDYQANGTKIIRGRT
jgi:hypothetical protein